MAFNSADLEIRRIACWKNQANSQHFFQSIVDRDGALQSNMEGVNDLSNRLEELLESCKNESIPFHQNDKEQPFSEIGVTK
jgi:hypothetical protein